MSHKKYTMVTNTKGDTAIRIDEGKYENVVLILVKLDSTKLKKSVVYILITIF